MRKALPPIKSNAPSGSRTRRSCSPRVCSGKGSGRKSSTVSSRSGVFVRGERLYCGKRGVFVRSKGSSSRLQRSFSPESKMLSPRKQSKLSPKYSLSPHRSRTLPAENRLPFR